MEYKDFNDDGAAMITEYNSQTASSAKESWVYGVHGVLMLCAFILLCLGCVSWLHHDVSGECMLLNSGTTYISSNPVCAAETPVPTTMTECMKVECKKLGKPLSEDPVYGQCYAGPLAISSGSIGIAAALAGIALANPLHKSFNWTLTTVLLIGALGCGVAAGAMSFWRFGDQTDVKGVREDRAVVTFGTCAYTYGDARGDYKAMTAFGFITAIVTIGSVVAEYLHWANQKPLKRTTDINDGDFM